MGHGRNVVLGDSIIRTKSNGYDVMPVNYIGDEGTRIAKCLWQIDQYEGEGPSTIKLNGTGKDTSKQTTSLKTLMKILQSI